jgi:hypothetical protein
MKIPISIKAGDDPVAFRDIVREVSILHGAALIRAFTSY